MVRMRHGDRPSERLVRVGWRVCEPFYSCMDFHYDIKFGQMHVGTIWKKCDQIKTKSIGYRKYINELGWREFSHSLINYFPEFLKGNFRLACQAKPRNTISEIEFSLLKRQAKIPIENPIPNILVR